MTKKKEIKQIFENLELESSDVRSTGTGPLGEAAGQETAAQNVEQAADEEAALRAEMLAVEQEGQSGEETPAEEVSQAAAGDVPEGQIPSTGTIGPARQEPEEENLDDILGDVRKSLLEEDAQEQEQTPKWWKRIGRSSRKKKDEAVTPLEEIPLPALNSLEAAETASAASQETETAEYQEQIDALIDMLDQEEEPVEEDLSVALPGTTARPEPQPEPEPAKPIDLDELKKQAFQPRPVEDENVTEVRSIAFEGEEEVFVEVEAGKPDVLEERLSAVENALKPYQRYINFSLAFLGLVMAVIAAFLIYNAYQKSVVQATPVPEVSNLPFPTSVGLPGGWNFSLEKGSLTAEGSWNPAGAEWLQGTEICRWVALPYSRQLEAVIRTLNPDDPIELGMSNNDKLVYSVYSIKQMSPEEMQQLDSNSPCLLIVLAEPGAENRWVLTALP